MPRARFLVRGTVQGVGFRPQVYRAATALGLSGFVHNAGGRVEIEAQGPTAELARFAAALGALELPAHVTALERSELPEIPDELGFRIGASSRQEAPLPALPADLAPCAACLAELAGSGRRREYAFTACAQCGPRFSVVEQLPYDRAATTLRDFPLCAGCASEYAAPADRRFHAQAIACPVCGPRLELLDARGLRLALAEDALRQAARELQNGAVLGLKGVGGFQLLVLAEDEAAVQRLRARKRREGKPFAVLFADLAAVERYADVAELERELLVSPESPIVLCQRKPDAQPALAAAVAPDNPQLGCLLPASPLHWLLARAVGAPLVCTSGNRSGEPLCVELGAALERLADVADLFLSHDRAIARPLDDSVARVGPGGVVLLRRARGFAPKVVAELERAPTVLALGAELKAAPSLLLGGALVLGAHVGDLGQARTLAAFRASVADLLRFYQAKPELIACDLHPDYSSTRVALELATSLAVPLVRVQHHHAHIAGVLAEHRIAGPVLGLAWDGTGLGGDDTIWGGEALIVDQQRAERCARLPRFRLPGGDRAAREPWRSALGLLHAVDPELARVHGARWLAARQLEAALLALTRGLNAPLTSSVGRLFDAVCALSGGPRSISFEGQAAMELEFLARSASEAEPYPLTFERLACDGSVTAPAGLAPLVHAVLHDVAHGVSRAQIAGRFQAALVAAAVNIATDAKQPRVVLSGGCFQNQALTTGIQRALEARGHAVYGAAQIPGNDGGISAGQAAVAAWRAARQI